MKPDFVIASTLFDQLLEKELACAVLVTTGDTSLEMLSMIDKLEPMDISILVVMIDSDEAANTLQVSRVPQLRFYKQGNETHTHTGTLSFAELHNLFVALRDHA